ncbi:conserved hypothetical protein [Campylobacter jejuni subsp. jejuni 305]|nr:conserved hypothetical protein [Campylobacter jejuni subsp. jejuni 305]
MALLESNSCKKELGLLHNDLIILAYGSNDALFKGFEKQKFKNNLKNGLVF